MVYINCHKINRLEEGIITDTVLKESRVCFALRNYLKTTSDNENSMEYETLGLKWILPIESTNGLKSAIKNLVHVMYLAHHNYSRKQIERIIENDIYPMVAGLKDEYDFILASVILVISKEETVFSSESEMMDLAIDIVGKYVYALEYLHEYISSSEENKNLSIEEGITNISEGMVIKNYPELCSILGQPTYKTGSNSYKAQLKEFERYFKWEKYGQKFVIVDIYDEPLPKQDGRKKGNNSIYVTYIEAILLKYLSCKKDYTCYLTKNQLFYLLGMINGYYKRITLPELEMLDIRITKWELDNFYFRCNQRLTEILFSALRSLENRSYISYTEQMVIVTDDNKYYVANDYEIKQILKAEKIILERMGKYSKSHVACCYKMAEFYSLLNAYLSEHYGWSRTFKRYKIISNQEFLQQGIQENEFKLQRLLNNEQIIMAIDKNASKLFDRQEEKLEQAYERAISECIKNDNFFGMPTKKQVKEENNIYTFPKVYVEVQKILSKKLLKIDDGQYKRKSKYVPMKFDFSQDEITELDVLFTDVERE